MANLSTEQVFRLAIQRIDDIQLTDNQRMAFYGLQKQYNDGDCTIPPPAKGNITARAKYDAWVAYKGLSKETAMLKYIQMMEKIDPNFKTAGSSSQKTSSSSTSTSVDSFQLKETKVLKSGILYKQRDVFKGWQGRYFVLDENFLHYYLKEGDDIPKKSLQIFGCSITVIKSSKAGETEYYPFVLAHPKSTKIYNFSTHSKAETDAWVTILTDMARREPPPSIEAVSTDRLLARRPVVDTDDADLVKYLPMNKELTLQHIPEKYAGKIEVAVETIVQSTTATDADGWIPVHEKKSVKISRKQGVGGGICVRGETLLPYSISEIFSLLSREDKRKKIDNQMSSAKKVKYFSSNTSIDYIRSKQVWPNPIRDFCNLTHWRLLSDGSFVIVSFSEKFDELCPLEEGVVRAELILGGYVMRPRKDGTQVYHIIQADLRASIPSTVTTLIACNQPLLLSTLRTLLDIQAKTQPRASILARKPVTFEELLFIAEHNKVDHSATAAVNELSKEVEEKTAEPVAEETPVTGPDKLRKSVKTAVSSALNTATDPDKRREKLGKLNTASLSVLFLPVALYFAVSNEFRALAFVFGFFYALDYVMRVHLGIPHRKVASMEHETIPDGRMMVRFNVDLTKLLRYLESSREVSGTEITVTHIAVKAIGVALSEIPNLNGHVIGGDFYQNRSGDVDVSVSAELFENETVVLKIEHADLKPIDYIATELKTRAQHLREGTDPSHTRKARLLSLMPAVFSGLLRKLFNTLCGKYGISFPLIGLVGFPHGACTVITLPSKEASDHDIDIAVTSNMTDSATPIVVTIGGVRLQPILDQDKKLAGSHVLNVAISIDNNAGSLAEGKRFASRLQQLMNNPSLLDKKDRQLAISKEDEKVAEEKAAHRAAIFKRK